MARAPAAASKSPAYRTVSIPAGLVDRAERIATSMPMLGYSSKAALIEDALRRFLDELERHPHNPASGRTSGG